MLLAFHTPLGKKKKQKTSPQKTQVRVRCAVRIDYIKPNQPAQIGALFCTNRTRHAQIWDCVHVSPGIRVQLSFDSLTTFEISGLSWTDKNKATTFHSSSKNWCHMNEVLLYRLVATQRQIDRRNRGSRPSALRLTFILTVKFCSEDQS